MAAWLESEGKSRTLTKNLPALQPVLKVDIVNTTHIPSLKLTCFALKMNGPKMNFLLGLPIFRAYVSFRDLDLLVQCLEKVPNILSQMVVT